MNNILNTLMKNKKVNGYTKMIILLSRLDYHKDYYIPNKKLMNILGFTKRGIIKLINQLENDNLIKLSYKGKKRYFKFAEEETKEEKNVIPVELYDYNWLEEE